MKYLVWDLETETHHSHKRKSNPFNPLNYIVLRGWKKEGDECATAVRFNSKDEVTPLTDEFLADVDVLVGHNLKFDLLYEMNVPGGKEVLNRFFKRGGRVWCSQYSEYLLNAQEQKFHMCAMDDIAESYGGHTKVGGLKAMWDAGIKTSEIDPDLLLDYLIGEDKNSGDIGNTEKIYLGQVEAAKELGMYQAILMRMDGLCATTDMEFNGLKIDMRRAKANLAKATAAFEQAKAELAQYISHIPAEVEFNWNSRTHVSCLIFGGTIKYSKQDTYLDEETGELARKWEVRPEFLLTDGTTTTEHPYDDTRHLYAKFAGGKRKGELKTKQVRFKGELKVKYQDFFFKCDGYTEPLAEWKSETTDGIGGPLYSTSGEVIDLLAKRDLPFCKALGNHADLNKEIGTYYIRWDEKKKTHVGMLTCVQPADWIIHHSLNHTSTVTSRLSANNPNMQNLTRADAYVDEDGNKQYKSEVKSLFCSRFGDDGEMCEADYSQLEVVVQGLLSKDTNLCRDLINKVDFHIKRASLKTGVSYEVIKEYLSDEGHADFGKWKKIRTKCKIFSFQR